MVRIKHTIDTYTTILGGIDKVIFLLDVSNKQVLYVNGKYSELLKAHSTDLLQSPASFLDLVHPKDYERVKAKYEELHDGKNAVGGIFRVRTRAGTFWVKVSTYGLKYKWKRFTQVVGVIEKVNKSYSINKKLREVVQVKNSLLNILTWDFKMPLNSILSLSEMIARENEYHNEELNEYIDLVKKISTVLTNTLRAMTLFMESTIIGDHPRKKLPPPRTFRRNLDD